jgi:hypothetical protein
LIPVRDDSSARSLRETVFCAGTARCLIYLE